MIARDFIACFFIPIFALCFFIISQCRVCVYSRIQASFPFITRFQLSCDRSFHFEKQNPSNPWRQKLVCASCYFTEFQSEATNRLSLNVCTFSEWLYRNLFLYTALLLCNSNSKLLMSNFKLFDYLWKKASFYQKVATPWFVVSKQYQALELDGFIFFFLLLQSNESQKRFLLRDKRKWGETLISVFFERGGLYTTLCSSAVR